MEQCFEGQKDRKRPGDIALLWPGSKATRTFFDIGITSLMAADWRTMPVADQAVQERYAKTKREKYGKLKDDVEFIPLIADTMGAWQNSCFTYFHQLATLVAARQRIPESIAKAQLMQRLSISLQRGNAACFFAHVSKRH
jgi:hypothetical protein